MLTAHFQSVGAVAETLGRRAIFFSIVGGAMNNGAARQCYSRAGRKHLNERAVVEAGGFHLGEEEKQFYQTCGSNY